MANTQLDMLRAFCTAAQELEIYDDCLLQSPSQEECLDHKFQLEAALEEGASEIIDLTGEDGSQEVSSRQATVLGDEAQEYSSYELPNGILLEPGKTIQLRQPVGAFQIEFVRIKAIRRPAWELDVRIRGLGFSRNENLNGMLPCWLNEVTMVAEFHNPNAIQWEQHSLLDIKVCDILCIRELRITNAPFPEHSSRASCQTSLGRRLLQETQGPLVCRFRFQIQYLSDHNTVPFERALIKINEEEADTDYRILDSVNLNRWRGGKVPGGSYRPGGPSDPIFDLEQSEPEPPHLMPRQRYTAGDVFSGAGGAARGMERAGVKLEFVVDNWSHAIESLRSNFPKTRVHGMSVADYCASEETKCKVDLMHLSPPCQYFSPAHTIRGKDDETNIKAFLTCPRIVERNKPRIFTMEETFGLLLDTHQVHLHKLICGFVELGYSMRWRCVRLSSWGVPQTRQRFLMIGSAPGEKLPPFPPYTHSKDGNGGLQPWVTPQSALAAISPTIENELHRLEPDKHFKHPRERWDPTTLAKTITCSGGQNYHWSGERDFTLLEYAVLQGFPTWHRFKGKCIKKQIGNAFSPTVVKVFYEHLINWLLVQDGFNPAAVRQEYAREGMPSDLTADNYIRLDDLDETGQTRKRKHCVFLVDESDTDTDTDGNRNGRNDSGNNNHRSSRNFHLPFRSRLSRSSSRSNNITVSEQRISVLPHPSQTVNQQVVYNSTCDGNQIDADEQDDELSDSVTVRASTEEPEPHRGGAVDDVAANLRVFTRTRDESVGVERDLALVLGQARNGQGTEDDPFMLLD